MLPSFSCLVRRDDNILYKKKKRKLNCVIYSDEY